MGSSGRILRFERPHPAAPGRSLHSPFRRIGPSPIADLIKYERAGTDPDDWWHRQLMNVAALAACTVLVVVGVWIAVKMAEIRRDQDCVLAGHRNCARISFVGEAPR